MKSILFLALLLISTQTFAWFCPGSFQQIQEGDTLEQVQKQCGKPASETKEIKDTNIHQEWKYFVAIRQPFQMTYSPSNNPPNQGTVRMTVVFFNNKAINITVMDQSLTSTSLCGPTINTGDTQETVKSGCGKPAFIQKEEGGAELEVIEYKYNSSLPNTLIFENGVLKYRR